MKDQTAFSTRFAHHKDELEWLFMELYHNREGLEVLEREMAEAYNARSAELKALDKARSADPEWYKRGNMFGMTMYTDLFAGNLKELAKKLPYLKEQKLTYLHLMPLLQMPHPHNDGGYAVEDFDTVDPALGTNKDLENLTRELRKAGISLCLDFVMNHTASTHRWAMEAKAGDPWFQAYYHLYEDRTIPDQYEQTVPQVFPNTAPGNFTWCEEMHKWVLTTFHDYQWDLNYANPAVFVDMTKSILHLANLGVEVFRIDAVPYIWKQLGTTCRNLPQVHTIVRMLRMVLECVCPAVILKGEVVMAPKELAAYFGTPEKPECHMLYNVSTMVNLWGALASRDTRLLKAQLDAIKAQGLMAEEALRLVQPGVLWRFFQTPLAERMRRADEEGRLYKEQQFVVGIPAREMDEADSDELVLIQGIIDAWFEDEDGAVLVDYKTDRIGEGEEAVLLDRYRLQLIYYRRALEQITGKTVRQAFLYSLALQKEIPVF